MGLFKVKSLHFQGAKNISLKSKLASGLTQHRRSTSADLNDVVVVVCSSINSVHQFNSVKERSYYCNFSWSHSMNKYLAKEWGFSQEVQELQTDNVLKKSTRFFHMFIHQFIPSYHL